MTHGFELEQADEAKDRRVVVVFVVRRVAMRVCKPERRCSVCIEDRSDTSAKTANA